MMRISLRALAVLLLQLLLLAMLVFLPRPIWTDEVLQFAWGAFRDSPRAARLIFWSVGARMNHGQTGIYMLVNHLALKCFGASYLALRFPSYLSYFFSLVAAYAVLARMGVAPVLRLAGMLGLAFSLLNITHGFEARPYVVLEASVLGFLWAWLRYQDRERHALPALFGIAAIGILFHPFFVVYAGCFVAGSLLLSGGTREVLREELARSRRIALLAGGVLALLVLYLAIGKLSWLNSYHKTFGLDPYEHVGHEKSLPRFMLGTFFYPFSIMVVPVLALLFVLLAWKRRAPELATLWMNALLLTGTLAVTQTVITASVIRAQYWILQRQWVAANALAFLVAALLAETGLRLVKGRISARALLVAELLLGFAGAGGAGYSLRASLREPLHPVVPIGETESLLARVSAQKEIPMGDFERLAKQNLFVGGPAWPIFEKLYLGNPNDPGGPPPP